MRKRQLTILQINDTHGYLEKHQEMFWEADGLRHEILGGYPRLRGLFENVRKERGSENVLVLDNGDTIHGTYPAVHCEGSTLVAPLNLLGIDAWTVHWDFVFGPERIAEIARQLDYPLLACNCHSEASDELLFQPTALIERAGVKVGIVGIAAFIIDKNFPQPVSDGYFFTLGNDELPRHIKALRSQGAELIVVLSHLGFPQDCKLAQEVDGIDVLLSGHTHNRMFEPLLINGATIIQSGCHGSFVGRLDIEIDSTSARVLNHELIKVDETIQEDEEMQRLVDDIYRPFRESLDEVIGETATDLNRGTTLEATMDNVLLDAISAAAGTEIAFSNGWRYGAPIPKGPVTVNDLWNIIPTNPYVETVELSGAEMWDMMEANLEATFATDPYEQRGGYVKRCRGLRLAFKIENRPGSRIQEFFAEGSRLDKARIYKVAFVSDQGVPPSYGRDRQSTNIRAIDALKSHFTKHPIVEGSLRGLVMAV